MAKAMTDTECREAIDKADKSTLWWAMYRLIEALQCARAVDPDCHKNDDMRGGLYTVVHSAADHWGPLVPGMPTRDDLAGVIREIAADEAYHERTFAAERMGIRITGDEFI